MSWFVQNQAPTFTSMQIQTSTSILPLPIVYGWNKIAPNLIYYGNFRNLNPNNGGKGGLFAPNVNGYSADVMLALCEGPIGGVGHIWRDQSLYSAGSLGLNVFNGTTPQAVWSYLSTTYPSQALAYQATAYLAAASYYLGSGASIGNHNVEIEGILAGTGANGSDADPAQVIYDFLTNPQYGAGFDPAAIDLTTLYGSGSDGSMQAYCAAMGICSSPALVDAEPASSILSRWLQVCNTAAVWSAGKLEFIPYGDIAVASGDVTTSVFGTPEGQPPVGDLTLLEAGESSTTYPPPQIVVCGSAQFVSDGGVKYAATGAAFTSVSGANPTSAGTYWLYAPGVYVFANADIGAAVEITYTYSIARGFTPNLTPVYGLSDLDFIDDKGNKDPVQVSRVDPFSLPNIVRVEVSSRSNQYSAVPIEARDQSQVELYGPRIGPNITAHEICDDMTVAPTIAQTLLQRGLYVRAKFAFKLSWEYCLLDPMDIVEITDSNLGLVNFPVRITAIEEDDSGLLSITAEELTVGVSTPATNPTLGARGYQLTLAAPAPPINAPLIFEPGPSATADVAQLWVGASPSSNASNWGGCNVYASIDDVSYSQIATIGAPMRQGVLTAALAPASGWDTSDTLSVSLAMSAGTLSGTSLAAAQAGGTLSLVDNEMLAYESAMLSGANAYNLTGLQRGLSGTSGAAHATGASFYRLDSAIVKYDLPTAYIGVPLYFKFQSFNASGAGEQALSACTVYSYTPSGAGEIGPVAASLATGAAMDWGHTAGDSVSETDDWGSCSVPVYSVIDLGNCSS